MKHRMAAFLTVFYSFAFVGVLAMFCAPLLDGKEPSQLGTFLLGNLVGFSAAGVQFYLGSSEGSKTKDRPAQEPQP